MKKTCLRRYLKPAFNYIFGSFNAESFEQRLSVIGCLSVAVIALIGTISNYFLGFRTLCFVTLGLSILSIIAFTILRKGHFSRKTVVLIAVGAVIYYNAAWFLNFGSNGPTLFAFMSIYIFLTLIWARKRIIWLILISFLNLFAFYIIERHFPTILSSYRDNHQRLDDLYSSVAFVLIIVFIITIYIKLNYLDQYEKAKRSDQLKTAFLANMSHEIRTPLNALVGFSSILSEEELPKEEIKSINRILEMNSKQLLYLIEDIIDLSKIEVNELMLFNRRINAERFFKRVEDEIRGYMSDEKRASVQFHHDIRLSDNEFWGDEHRIEQVIRILLTNAVRFTDKGYIYLGLNETDSHWEFYVKDEGCGMKPEYMDSIFELFVKHKRKEDVHERGVGMGLYLGRKLVELMGGTIRVVSVFGGGSEFRFTIPKEHKQHFDFQ